MDRASVSREVESAGVPLVLVSVPNAASWSEVTSRLIDGTWDYADNGVADRTHIRWFTAASFTAVAHAAGFTVELSSALGEGVAAATASYGPLFASLPEDQRFELAQRQFIFWLRANTTESGAHNHPQDVDTMERGVDDAEAHPLADSEERSAQVAIAIVTSSPTERERLAQVATAWAAWDFPALLETTESPLFIVAISDGAKGSSSDSTSGPLPCISLPGISDRASGHMLESDFAGAMLTNETGISAIFHDVRGGRCVPVVRTSCSAAKAGIPCKSMAAFATLARLAAKAHWYLRVMDDTLVVPASLLRALSLLDHTQPLYVGDLAVIPADGLSGWAAPVPLAFGGCGWGLSAPALATALLHRHIWSTILHDAGLPEEEEEEKDVAGVSSAADTPHGNGESPATAGLRLDSPVADDVLFGLFLASLPGGTAVATLASAPRVFVDAAAQGHLLASFPSELDLAPGNGADPLPGITAVPLVGWTQAPVDFASGVGRCDDGLDEDRTLGVDTDDVDACGPFRVHDLGRVDGHSRRVLAFGACRKLRQRSKARGVAELLVAHMGDEIGGESGLWRQQLGSRAVGGFLQSLHAHSPGLPIPLTLTSFEPTPLWYWRMCVPGAAQTPSAPQPPTLRGPNAEAFLAAAARSVVQTVSLGGASAELVVRLCERPARAARRLIRSIGALGPTAAAGSPDAITDTDTDADAPCPADGGPCAQLEALAAKLRDSLRLHARPAAVPVVLRVTDGAGGWRSEEARASVEVGDDPVAAAREFARRHGVGPDGAAAVTVGLEKALLPFNYTAVCRSAVS